MARKRNDLIENFKLSDDEVFRHVLTLYTLLNVHQKKFSNIKNKQAREDAKDILGSYYVEQTKQRIKNLKNRIPVLLNILQEFYAEIANEQISYRVTSLVINLRKLFSHTSYKTASHDQVKNLLSPYFFQYRPDKDFDVWYDSKISSVIDEYKQDRAKSNRDKSRSVFNDFCHKIIGRLIPNALINTDRSERKIARINKVIKIDKRGIYQSEDVKRILYNNLWLFNPSNPNYQRTFLTFYDDFLEFNGVSKRKSFAENSQRVFKTVPKKIKNKLSNASLDLVQERLNRRKFKKS
ncbi:MAG: hypothetical protein R2877_07345 [Bdellovibrionota bacterium]